MSDSGQNEVIPVLLPQAGNSMEEGTILKWMVSEGDQVKEGDLLYELETDKASIEVEAEQSGRLAKILVQEDETAPVMTPVALLSESDEAAEKYLASSGAETGEEAPASGDPGLGEGGYGTPAPEPTSGGSQPPAAPPMPNAPQTAALTGVLEPSRVKASPVARKFAETHNINLERCAPGSGPDGRVLLEDVKAKEGQAPTAPSPPQPSAKPTPPPVMASGTSERKPMSKMRAAIGRNLQASKQNVPHFYMRVTVNADGLVAYREREKQLYKCSVNDVVTEACARVIMEMPEFRTQVDGDHLVTHADANIGLAVALEGGLVVPVVKAAHRMNLQGIAEEARRIAEEARKGKIEGQGEGVFTISNLGMFGVEEFSAIINPPEAAILAVGAVREEVYADNGAIRVGKRLTMTLSSDHRVIDGVAAAKFCARLREILESLGD